MGSAIEKYYRSRINVQKNTTDSEYSILIGCQGLKGGSMELHLAYNKRFIMYNCNKIWGFPILKLILGIFTIIFNFNDNYYFSTQSIGGFQLVMEGCTDLFREIFENMQLPSQMSEISVVSLKKDEQRKKIKKEQIIYTLKTSLFQVILIAIELYIMVETIKTSLTLDLLSSIFEMILIFTSAVLCFVENFSQFIIRVFTCKTFHSQNRIICTQFQFKYKPSFLIFLSMVLCTIFVFVGKQSEQAAFFPTLAVYIISDGINQLKINDGTTIMKQMKEQKEGWFSDLSAEQKVHQIALLQDIISFRKYLACFQLITSVLLIMPFRFMDSKYGQAELFVFIFLLLVASLLNVLDSYYYTKIYKLNNKGFEKYKSTLSKYKEEKAKEIEMAKK